jgi:hypothetical protein
MLARSLFGFFAFVVATSAAPLDVFVPPIITPTATTVWIAGAVESVTWYVPSLVKSCTNVYL